jgi:type II secretory pathway predicted ATPase ExeA
MIEEAHDLSIQTMKYLKRFWEMEDGFKKLLSIVHMNAGVRR